MKEDYLRVVNSFKLKNKTKEILKTQIEMFYSYQKKNDNKFFINDEVKLFKNNLIYNYS
jgi:hypothetical protein